MKYKYLTIYKFNNDLIAGLEQSVFELEKNKVVNDYKIRIEISKEQFNEIAKLLPIKPDGVGNND